LDDDTDTPEDWIDLEDETLGSMAKGCNKCPGAVIVEPKHPTTNCCTASNCITTLFAAISHSASNGGAWPNPLAPVSVDEVSMSSSSSSSPLSAGRKATGSTALATWIESASPPVPETEMDKPVGAIDGRPRNWGLLDLTKEYTDFESLYDSPLALLIISTSAPATVKLGVASSRFVYQSIHARIAVIHLEASVGWLALMYHFCCEEDDGWVDGREWISNRREGLLDGAELLEVSRKAFFMEMEPLEVIVSSSWCR